jgi:YfiH family protein
MQAPDFDCLIPDWPAPPSVRALCSTRAGGASSGRYASLNLGLHVGDDPGAVQDNRQRLQAAMGVRAVFLDQVHGSTMQALSGVTPDGLPADGAYTTTTGAACTVMVADCLPVLLCDTQGEWVAAAHAGWRGLLGAKGRGILESAVAAYSGRGDALMAWLGPCIGPHAFEVGDEVRAAFLADMPQASACFTQQLAGKWMADLPDLARMRLAAAGVGRIFGNDGTAPWCTAGNPSRFFSHRRDRISGRMAACIWRID